MTVTATIEPGRLADDCWDAVVVGAGPAGAIAARQLSQSRFRTLLVDRKAFPRSKVCGACLNRRAVTTLELLELDGILDQLRALPLGRFCVRSGGRRVDISLPGGVAVTRAAFDTELVRAAIEAGAEFLPETSASLGDDVCEQGGDLHKHALRHIRLAQHGQIVGTVVARVVLLADGLGNPSLQPHDELRSRVDPKSRIGLGAIVNNCPAAFPAGTIHMAVAKQGYVGLVRVEDGNLNVAAAIDPEFVRLCRQPAVAIDTILNSAGFPAVESLESADWSGTVPLTRQTSRPAGKRVLLIGDAAGYVEPFTGEGISCALSSGVAAASLVSQRLATWDTSAEQQWLRLNRRLIRDRQRWCRRLAWLLRHPVAVRGLLSAMSRCPWLARPIVESLNEPPGRYSTADSDPFQVFCAKS
jgi:flavin-dependent dehydrogenase